METKSQKTFPTMLVTFLFFILAFVSSASQAITEKSSSDTYIVLLQKPEGISTDSEDLDTFYQSFLPAPASTQSSNQQGLIFSYRNVLTGFAAKLTAEEAKAMEEKKGFVSARPEKVLPLHTTHTPSFLGLQRNFGVWNHSKYGKGVIIGLLDTGIYPEHPSFSDVGMPPPPAKWKGKCEFNETACNNKIIGGRNFISKEPPWDYFGHGTYTSSTAAGSPVPGENYFGQVNGTATGLAPLAHLAMYKVCSGGCGESAILAAMDAAVEDGVDILSLSLGGGSSPFYDDVIALGAFGATQKGVFVSCSAGNSGPFNKSLSNEAPWILTVGASIVDREIRATVLLGNKGELNGQSLFQPKDFPSTLLPLVYAGSNGNQSLAWCEPGSLKNIDVKGKIVLCERGGNIAPLQKGQEVKNNGGAAMILMNDELNGYVTIADPHVLPASHVSYKAGLDIKTYINSTSSPMATISFRCTVLGVPDAPQVASFSSRGPSLASPGILKPDVIGPGVDILAAWPYSYDNNSDDPSTKFNMISGTSVSCPHLSGVAALLKSIHPEWSPAAIKSAIVTTTDIYNIGGSIVTDQQFVAATFFDMGAGHVNPARASRPGVVYDIQPDDYIPYLCGLGYSDKQVGLILQHPVHCSSISSIPEAELNYPSFSIKLGLLPLTYTRTLTNVGEPNSVYTAKVVMSAGVDVKITPGSISFTAVNQKATFSVTFGKNANATGSFAEGYLYWFSDQHGIRTPIAVLFD